MTILDIQKLTRRFGGLFAVSNLSFSVEEGEIRGLIGPNGAGKTTTFNVISGFYPPSEGRVMFLGDDISGMPTNAIAARGLVRTFQATTLFQEFTVLENVLVGCHPRPGRIPSGLCSEPTAHGSGRSRPRYARRFSAG